LDLDRAMGHIWQWWAVAVVFLIVATCIRSDATLRLAVGAFVAGAVLTILAGLALGNVGAGEATTRFTGGAGDPNFLASGLVPSIVLAGGLAGASKAAGLRWTMLAVIAFLALGVVMSESRGAAVASVVTVAAALIFFKHRRVYVIALAMVAVGFAVLTFAVVPGSWERVSNVGESGARGDIWTVAWRVGEDHALVGVGAKSFQAAAADYVQEPGTLTNVGSIAEDTKVVHNLYLELFAEIGIVGLSLFLIVVVGCLQAAWLAARRFEALGRPDLETVARSILVANIAMLSTAIFLSSQVDKRLWILLALGPAALEVSRRASPRIEG
jgi:putative inorganic carbon (hco3(-)) transporter